MTVGTFFIGLAVWFLVSCLAAPLIGCVLATTNIGEH